jgi:hypothetical protein
VLQRNVPAVATFLVTVLPRHIDGWLCSGPTNARRRYRISSVATRRKSMAQVAPLLDQTLQGIEQQIKELERRVSSMSPGFRRRSLLAELTRLRADAGVKRWLTSAAPGV